MPITPRPISEMGYYHLTARGNGKQTIFEESNDYKHFLNNLKQYSAEHAIAVNAFCLMENHIHLLICDPHRHKSMFMKRLIGNYAIWFNKKYERSGHLFESRYGCHPIESDARLCTVFRYILNNPREAGICPAAEYPYSSYSRYGKPNSFVDTKVLTEMLGSFEEYAAFINAKYETGKDEEEVLRNNDEWAKQRMCAVLNVKTGAELRDQDRESRNEAIRKLREEGISIRQIERLTGISKGAIQRAIKE